MFPSIQCQCFDKRRDVYLLEIVSVFNKIRVRFWPEISDLGVFLNFDNERMRPPSVPECPPTRGCKPAFGATRRHMMTIDGAISGELAM